MNFQHRTGLVIVAALSAVGVASTTASADFVTGFEQPDYLPGGLVYGQDGWNSPDSARVQTASQLADELTAAGLNSADTVHGGNQALIVSGGHTHIRQIDGLQDATRVAMDFWVRPLTPGTDGSTIGQGVGNTFLTMEDSSGTRAAAVRLGAVFEDDAVTATSFDLYSEYYANWVDTGASWQPDAWYNLRMEVDYESKTYDLYVNGSKVTSESLMFYNTGSESLSRIRIFNGSGQAGAILDDISVAAVPEPATLGLLLAGGGMMVRRGTRPRAA